MLKVRTMLLLVMLALVVPVCHSSDGSNCACRFSHDTYSYIYNNGKDRQGWVDFARELDLMELGNNPPNALFFDALGYYSTHQGNCRSQCRTAGTYFRRFPLKNGCIPANYDSMTKDENGLTTYNVAGSKFTVEKSDGSEACEPMEIKARIEGPVPFYLISKQFAPSDKELSLRNFQDMYCPE